MLEIILAGNPNVGKSTVFNALTGLKQHTGNWSGKTVELATGHNKRGYKITDLPGTYSLTARSREEEIARNFIYSSGDNAVIAVICDASCLERNLILALQIIELTPRCVLCVNFMDEAVLKGISIDKERLSVLLGVPVVLTAARSKQGLNELLDAVTKVMRSDVKTHEKALSAHVEEYVRKAEKIHAECVSYTDMTRRAYKKADRILTGRLTGIPVMFAFFMLIFWITITGANYPTELLMSLFSWLELHLKSFMYYVNAPVWLVSVLTDGVYSVLTWVVAVMLPPMAIFFPLFTLLEDLGYLPRVAFILDRFFKKANACGKQALTMMMGFGCNACGVIGARIIDSPRERLLAILTNVFVPCNGRFPPPVLG